MTVKVAINGFGRIGRCVLRALLETKRDDIEVVAINAAGSLENNLHLLKYDSVHGRYRGPLSVDGNTINLGYGPIRMSSTRAISELDWSGVDVVMECTGKFNSKEQSIAHLNQGAKRVLVSAPAKNADKTIVYGVNDDTLTPNDLVVSNASCTTNCLAPVAKVLDDAFGIEKGIMTTIHAYTGDQPTMDRTHKDFYRGRAAAMSMVPTSTGAAKAVGEVLPNLKGKLDGSAIRVPTANVSVVDLKAVLKTHVTEDEINEAMRAASLGSLAGVLGYEEEPLVSIDFNHDPHSSVFAAPQTKILDGNLVRVMSWYDNEWGFSNRMIDLAVKMGNVAALEQAEQFRKAG